MKINRFIDQIKAGGEYDTQYNAGVVGVIDDKYIVAYQTMGAEETFSVGQPVYDKDGEIMGYLGIGMLSHLDYSTRERVPVEYWEICLATKHCEQGKAVFTYWQNGERKEKE